MQPLLSYPIVNASYLIHCGTICNVIVQRMDRATRSCSHLISPKGKCYSHPLDKHSLFYFEVGRCGSWCEWSIRVLVFAYPGSVHPIRLVIAMREVPPADDLWPTRSRQSSSTKSSHNFRMSPFEGRPTRCARMRNHWGRSDLLHHGPVLDRSI